MSEEKESKSEGKRILGKFKEGFGGIVKGMGSQVALRQILKERMYKEHLFMLITMGDMLGMPILPPYYSLRLLPYVMPNIKAWRRQLLEEKDFTDRIY